MALAGISNFLEGSFGSLIIKLSPGFQPSGISKNACCLGPAELPSVLGFESLLGLLFLRADLLGDSSTWT